MSEKEDYTKDKGDTGDTGPLGEQGIQGIQGEVGPPGTTDYGELENVPETFTPAAHKVASHSDTTATGAELETLTDNSVADALHRHSKLVAPDGAPDPALSVDNAGVVSIPKQSGFAAYLSSDQDIADVTYTTVIFDTEEFDYQGEYNTATGVFTAKQSGVYQVSAALAFKERFPDSTYMDVIIRKNEYQFVRNRLTMSFHFNPGGAVAIATWLALGDTLYIDTKQNAGEARLLYGADDPSHDAMCRFSAVKIA